MLESVRGGWITLEVSPGRHTVPQGRGLDKRHVEAEHNNTEHKRHVVDNTATHNTEHNCGHKSGTHQHKGRRTAYKGHVGAEQDSKTGEEHNTRDT